jgi:hypothetical protein
MTRSTSSQAELATENFDIFISAYDASDRVKAVFSSIGAQRKLWVIHPEYQFHESELVGIGD